MAGCADSEGYFGVQDGKRVEGFRTRQSIYQQTRIAVDFFQLYLPFTEMENMNDMTTASNDYVDYVLAKVG